MKKSILVSFPVCFPGDAGHDAAALRLSEACGLFSRVFVAPLFRQGTVDAGLYQQFLAHVYLSLAQQTDEVEVVVVDPSVGVARILNAQTTEEGGKRRNISERIWAVDAVSPEVARLVPAAADRVVPGWNAVASDDDEFPYLTAALVPRVSHVVNGGTFDRLHNGHRLLLGVSVAVASSSLTVGITSDLMIHNSKKTLKELVQPYSDRRREVEAFIRLCNPDIEAKTPAIEDAFGPSIVDGRLEAIVVSEETKSGGDAVNAKRKEAGLSQLQVIVVDVWDSHSNQKGSIESKISSTDQRRKIAAANNQSKI